MATKCLILGAKGMLGTELSFIFRDYHPILWDRAELDITIENDVEEKIEKLKPQLIINSAAYTNVDGAETNQEVANKVNGEAVGYLARVAKELDAVLIHYSTDYVFDGKNKEGYKENDPTNPINAYGQSKLIGEKALRENCRRYYLIRTSWLYGKIGNNFVETIIRLGKEKNEVRVVNDQFGKPTYAVDLAQRTRELVEERKEYNIYHITNEGVTSWYGFAKEIYKQIGLTTKVIPVGTSEFPRPAQRPNYSSLINTKLTPSRHWKEALAEYFAKR
ncbi:MAG: dTDP-4-dehydrorhamnose reductase [Candidatus Kerfeldbacteria bacterium CG08_land_8_20_14_0_20_40_16]|uniref:dTDP-4-dehydrorhamnose reductase n=1 Tax=Candidatus Kerfeldbacteria bacterium CG08_land_8_20_14_0_20_40_16 TaxID=2014244 RepID=A0A2H0YVC6_9BACT|nr:MAG: dTDP-4-dehydrorhamnose reductase [Candidatus Kerfeldbacteria bacterium CG08_land_8_20_14_0_20_40_16]